jgi:DNA-binding MarR family transcriptional regulator
MTLPAQAKIDTSARPEIEDLRLALYYLLGAERRLRSRDHNRPGELTNSQLRLIAALGREHEMTAGQLARQADLTPAGATASLDRLEAADIIVRRRSLDDRRVCNVTLTPHGLEVLSAKVAEWQARWERQFAEFTVHDIAAAVRVLGQITVLLDALAFPAAESHPDL